MYRNIPTLSLCESKRYTIFNSFSNKFIYLCMVMFSFNTRYAFYNVLLYISILDVFGYQRCLPVAMDPCPLCRSPSALKLWPNQYWQYVYRGGGIEIVNTFVRMFPSSSNILYIFEKLARRLDRIIHGDQVLTRTVLGQEFLIARRHDPKMHYFC